MATTPTTTAAADNGDEDAQETSPYDEKYGTFKAINKKGSGDSTVPLPEGASAAMVAMTHDGSANFSVTTLGREQPAHRRPSRPTPSAVSQAPLPTG